MKTRLPISAPLALLVLALAGAACSTTRDSLTASPPAEETPTAETPTAETPAAEAEAPTYANTIRWKTASALDNFGFNVYRAESPDGPFVQINPRTIDGAGTSDEIHAYKFVDREIDPYKPYFYYVESISMSGDSERFTPVGKVEPKIPVEPQPATDEEDSTEGDEEDSTEGDEEDSTEGDEEDSTEGES